jgi:hypothetical protein
VYVFLPSDKEEKNESYSNRQWYNTSVFLEDNLVLTFMVREKENPVFRLEKITIAVNVHMPNKRLVLSCPVLSYHTVEWGYIHKILGGERKKTIVLVHLVRGNASMRM